MLAKISAEVMKAIGAETASEVDSQMSAFIAEANKNKTSMAENQVTLESIQKSVTALEGKLLTEDRVRALITEQFNAASTKAVSDFLASDAGKKIIGAEASRVVMEAHAAIGTTPAKPSPAPSAGGSAEEQSKALIAVGKYEEAFPLLSAAERSEFLGPKSYAAYMRNRGNTVITSK